MTCYNEGPVTRPVGTRPNVQWNETPVKVIYCDLWPVLRGVGTYLRLGGGGGGGGGADFVKLLATIFIANHVEGVRPHTKSGGGGSPLWAHRKYVIVNNTRFCVTVLQSARNEVDVDVIW